MENGRIAIPSNGQGGMGGTRAGHFGHCDVFTIVDVENCKMKEIYILKNMDHMQGGCMVPVNLLSENRVNAIIVGGIGMRPLMGFKQMGIAVFHDDQRPDIEPVVKDLIAGNLAEIRNDQVCGGGGGPV